MKPREPRRKVFIKARVRIGGSWGDVCVRDISSRGLLLQARSAPPRGTFIEVRRGRHVIIARVVWALDERFGVQAQDRISVEGFVGEPDLRAIDFEAASRSSPGFERRSVPRTSKASLQEKAEQSRRASAVLQFAVLTGLGAIAATMAFDVVAQTLSAPVTIISAALQESSDSATSR
jgi:hypothetical protein